MLQGLPFLRSLKRRDDFPRQGGFAEGGVGTWVISEEKREGRDFGRAMGDGIMLEFCESKELGPLMGIAGAEDTKVSFDFLIGSFSLSISLRVVRSGESNIVFEDSSEFLGKRRGELGSSVRDEGVMKSEAFKYMIEKELGNTVCINGL